MRDSIASLPAMVLAAAVVALVAPGPAMADDAIDWRSSGPRLKAPRLTPEIVAALRARPDWNAKPLQWHADGTDEDLKTVVLLRDDLVRLSLADCKKVSDLSPLAELTKLESLNIRGVPFKDLAFVAALKELEELEMFMTTAKGLGPGTAGVTDIAPFKGLANLKKLHFYACPFTDASPLADAVGMEDLSLYMAKVADLTPLKGMTKLERLSLYSVPAKDLSPLAGMTELTYIWLYATKCDDYSVLKSMTKMEEMDFGISTFSQVEVIEAMPKLKKLGVWKCPIREWKSLKTAKGLEELILNDTSFADCTLLEGMTKLKWLKMEGCAVKDLTPVAKLASLQYLSLNGIEGITDLTFLKDAPKLQYVYLSKDQVAPEVVEKLEATAPKLKVSVSGSRYR